MNSTEILHNLVKCTFEEFKVCNIAPIIMVD